MPERFSSIFPRQSGLYAGMFIFVMMLRFDRTYWRWLIPLLAAIYCLIELQGEGDFFIFLSAASDLAGREDIFEKVYVDGYHYFYSVLFAVILKFFVTLPFLTVKYFWLLLNALLFFDLFRLIYRSEMVTAMGTKRDWFVLLCFLASLRFFTGNIHTSQITILILWCCIRGLMLVVSAKNIAGSLILALGINIKLLPLVLLPYLIYRGYFKASLLTVVFYFLMLLAPSLLIGHEYNMQLLGSWLKLLNPTNQEHVLDVSERSFHGLSTLLSTLLVKDVPDVYALDIPRHIADVSLATLSKIITLVRLLLILLTLYFVGKRPFIQPANSFQQCLEVSYILLLVPLIFPHQQHYAFLFAMPALALLMYDIMLQPQNNMVRAIVLVLVCLVFNLSLILGVFNEYYDHFKIITWAALLLIPLLVSLKRKTGSVVAVQQ